MGIGVGLFLFAAVHHVREILLLDGMLGPVVALILDGLPPVGLVYAGFWLSQTELTLENHRRVVIWSFGGGFVFLAVIGATFLVRTIEGRPIAELVFPLLIAFEAGSIAGLTAGYYSVRAREDARRAKTVSDALVSVNKIIRHDLRNDLAVIEGYAELIESSRSGENGEQADVDPTVIVKKAGEGLERIEATGAIADTLVGEPDLEPTDLTLITDQLATRTQSTFDVTVTTDLPEQALVSANPGLRSVVDNLIENAVEHNDGDDPRITVTVVPDEDTVRMTISDNGPGIPEAEKETLFDSNGNPTDGSGITLVQTLVEGYDGHLRVENNEPCGTTFIVELPAAAAQAEHSVA